MISIRQGRASQAEMEEATMNCAEAPVHKPTRSTGSHRATAAARMPHAQRRRSGSYRLRRPTLQDICSVIALDSSRHSTARG